MAETKAASKPKTVKIKFDITRHEKNDEYAAINGKPYLIKRGEYVEVPEAVAEVFETRNRMLAKAYAFEEEASAKANAKELK